MVRGTLLRRRLAILVVMGVLASSLVAVASPPVAQAATIATGVTAELTNHQGTTGTDTTNCIRYQPSGSSTSTTYVGPGTEALTAHGYNPTCPTNLSTATQSALGVTPSSVASVTDGNPFLLTTIKHYNNPISGAAASRYRGNLNVRLSNFDGSPTLSFPWTMWETPNADNPCAYPNGPNQNGCADQMTFTGSAATQTLTKDGISYKLVINGFSSAINNACPATPGNTTPSEDFLTAERAVTTACIYATLSQVRSLRINKVVVGSPPGTPSFGYTGTSTVTGSPWAAAAFNLGAGGTRVGELLQGETVSVTETAPTGDQWTLTGLTCVDGAGQTLGAADGVTYSIGQGRVTLSDTPAPSTVAAGPITCTYTNTYTPKATLTLVKTVTGGSATVAHFTLTASGPTSIAGTSGSAAVTNQRVGVGTYTLSEATTVSGYVPGTWTCTAGILNGSSLTLADGQNATCTINNRFAAGNLRITKAVSGPDGGYTGTATTSFTGTYSCANGTNGTFSVSTGTPWVSPQLPAGTVCTVTEAQPTGSLADASYVWGAPGYTPSNGQVTITDGTTGTVAITNTYTRQVGTVRVSKAVTPRSGTPASGYTNGPTRTFPVVYTCRIGTTVTATGTINVSTASSVSIPNVPTTSICTFTETQTAASGDFFDASYAWDGYAFSPISVTVGNNTIASTTVTNYFIQRRASLTLAKVLQGDGYIGTGTPFTINWSCGLESGSVSLAPGGSQTVNVPANTACTVTETAPAESLLDANHDWLDPTYTGLTNGTVSVAPAGSATVTVTNATTAVYGTLAVVKRISPANLASGVVADARFRVTVACNAPARGQAANYTGVFQLAVGVAQQTPSLPLGTQCTVTETAPTQSQLLDASYAWGATPAVQTVTVNERDGAVTATVTNSITRVYGTLAITKIVQALGGVNGANTTFSGTWSCQYGNSDPLTGTWTRTGAGAATLSGPTDQLLIGSVCTVTETDKSPNQPNPNDSSYVWGPETVTGPVTLTVAAPNGRVNVTNPVRRITGGFGVGKTVRGGSPRFAFVNGNFTFDWRCTDPGGTATAGTLTILGGASANAPTQPAGSTCTLTETGRPNPVDPYRWVPGETAISINGGNEVTGQSTTFTIPADGVVSIQVFNVIRPVQVTATATKTISGATAGFTDTTATFSLTLVCSLAGNEVSYGPQDVRVGQTATFDGIPLGSACELREAAIPTGHGLADGSYAWGTPTFPDSPQTLSNPDGSYSFQVNNPIQRRYGNLQLTKALEAPSGVVNADRVYSGTWSCAHAPDATVNGTWTITGTGTATLTGVPAQGIFINANCTATETGGLNSPPSSDPSYSWLDPQISTIRIPPTGTGTIEVVNRVSRSTHDLTIAKTISGATAGYVGTGAPFAVDALCSVGGSAPLAYSATLAPGAAPELLLDDVPTGWTCTLAETPPAQSLLRNASYRWGTPTWTGVDANRQVTVAADGAIVVNNPITRVTGALQVAKAFAPGTPDGVVLAGATFTGTYSCSYNSGAPDAQTWTGTWSYTGNTGGNAVLTPGLGALPVGSSCQITENTPNEAGLFDQSWSWADPVIDSAVTIAEGGPQTLRATNSPERVYSAMSVTKRLTGETGGLATGSQVQVAWSCTFANQTVNSGVVNVSASGGTVQLFAADGSISNDRGSILIPAGAACTATESTPGQDLLVDTSYAWRNPPTYSPPGGRVTTAEDSTSNVTITNTIDRADGSLRIVKNITGNEGQTMTPGLRFTGGYSCTYGTDAPVEGTWMIDGEGSTTVPGILATSTCRVTEDPPAQQPVSGDPSFVWGTPVVTDPVTVAVGQTAEVTVTNPVERQLTDITIGKQVSGDASGVSSQEEYAYSYSCLPANGDPAITGSGTLVDGATFTTPTNIPPASTCTVTEGPLPSVEPGYAWEPVDFTVEEIGTNTATVNGQSVTFTVPPGNGADASVLRPEVTIENELTRLPASYTVNKTADPVSGSTVATGSTITYTIAVEVTGPGTINNVEVTDDLSEVLNNATFITSNAEIGIVELTGTTLTWDIGQLRADEDGRYTLTYSVRVNDDAHGVTLRNSVTADGEEPPAVCPECSTTTTHEVPPIWTLEKSSDPASGSMVAPGSTITYTVTVRNPSASAVTDLTVSDDLSQVLNNAAWGSVTTSAGTAERDGDDLTWTIPSVAANGSATMTYTVTVNDDAFGATLRNVVTGDGDVPPQPCETCTTTHEVPATWTLEKSSDPASGSMVAPGSTITYTVTVRNPSASAVTNVEVNDDLSRVLNNAAWGSVTTSAGTAERAGNTLTWTIASLPAGSTQTMTYTVTVNAGAANVTLRNVVVGDADVPLTDCPRCTTVHEVPPKVVPPVNPPNPPLPQTGTNASLSGLLIGLGLAAAGGLVLLASRRRRVG